MMGAAAAASPSPDHQQTSAAAAANSETTVTPSTSEPLAASSAKRTTYEQLEKRLMGFLEPGETLEPYNSSKAAIFALSKLETPRLTSVYCAIRRYKHV